MLALLESVKLPELADGVAGLNAVMDWGSVLLIGEQQRLAFARAIDQVTSYAMLDEATSAFNVANEESLYEQLVVTYTTLVSVGHCSTLLKYHTRVLEPTGDSEWQSHSAKDYRFDR